MKGRIYCSDYKADMAYEYSFFCILIFLKWRLYSVLLGNRNLNYCFPCGEILMKKNLSFFKIQLFGILVPNLSLIFMCLTHITLLRLLILLFELIPSTDHCLLTASGFWSTQLNYNTWFQEALSQL